MAAANSTLQKSSAPLSPRAKRAPAKRITRKNTPATIALARSARNKKLTRFVRPMLAHIHDAAFNDKDWLFEIKWDGYRAVAEKSSKAVRLYSRNGLSFMQLYPTIAQAIGELKNDVILDGEVVVLNEQNLPDFQKLQQYNENPALPILYYVFDCLSLNGRSTLQLPLRERKKILRKILPKDGLIRYSDHVEKDGLAFFKSVVSMNLEGMIAKRADSLYYPGKRTREWLKIKNHKTQEAIIAGYTAPRGSRTLIGALVLAINQRGRLKYIGHTGTGFTNQTLKELYKKLQPLRRMDSPLDGRIPVNAAVTWVEPVLVCNVKFTEITADGILRHPVFQGLRFDKTAAETDTLDYPAKRNRAQKTSAGGGRQTVLIEGHRLTVTNRAKIYFPGDNITKGDVIDYYNAVHKTLLPYLKDRPQSLRRTPDGITNAGFFQKEAGRVPPWIKVQPIRAETAKRTINYIICNDLATLTYLNNLGCIELNPWNSRAGKPDNPDYMVMDLDPSEHNTFEQVIEAACAIHEILERAGCKSYCKTSGASGLHIYIPLHSQYTYGDIQPFAELIAGRAAAALPETTTLERTLVKRKDRIYIDYMQNRKGQTLASVYSLRPKPGAPVSAPLTWKEVKKGLHPLDFNIKNMKKRLDAAGDLFHGLLTEKVNLKKCLRNLEK